MRALVIPSLLVIAWEVGGLVDVLPDSASRPSDIVRALVQAVADGSLVRDTWLTLQAALVGFAIAGALGILAVRAVERLRKTIVPAARRRIAVGFRLALAISLLIAVAGEIALDSRGLGHGILAAHRTLRPDRMYALLFWLGFVGWALDRGLRFAERRWLRSRSASV